MSSERLKAKASNREGLISLMHLIDLYCGQIKAVKHVTHNWRLPKSCGYFNPVWLSCKRFNIPGDNYGYAMKISEMNDANYIASHSATSAKVLHRLAQHSDVSVRMAVADNKNTHTITSAKLAGDDNPDLRYALAENHQIHSSVLDILAMDENPFVADRAQKTILRLKKEIPPEQSNSKLSSQNDTLGESVSGLPTVMDVS